jgi:orotidine-5'-phosphate decarboxylase
MSYKAPIVLALDTTDQQTACDWAYQAQDSIQVVKVGLEFFLSNGADGVAAIRKSAPSLEFFLDLKLHDIPNTVKGAALAVEKLNPDFLTVHASGGFEMIAAVVKALPNCQVTAVTVLTSISPEQLFRLGLGDDPTVASLAWSTQAVEAGAKAIVTSPQEVANLRKNLPAQIKLITPGVRPVGSDQGDQARVATPVESLQNGANLVVIGRPITAAGIGVSARAAEIAKQIQDAGFNDHR